MKSYHKVNHRIVVLINTPRATIELGQWAYVVEWEAGKVEGAGHKEWAPGRPPARHTSTHFFFWPFFLFRLLWMLWVCRCECRCECRNASVCK